jgi:sugar phosphate isomerase/epimerase
LRVLISDGYDINKTLPIAKEYKIGIEIQNYANPVNLDDDKCDIKVIADKIKDIPLRGFHGPFSDLIPATRDKLIRVATMKRFQHAYEHAMAVKSQHINFHPNFIPKTYTKEVWLENSVNFWTEFLADKYQNISFHLENVYEDDYNFIIELLERINTKLQAEAVTACVDIGHVNSNSSKPVEEWIKALGSRIHYVHLHNNFGILDDHFGLWNGNINIERTLDLLLEYAPESFWMLESRLDYIEQSAAWMKEKGYLYL